MALVVVIVFLDDDKTDTHQLRRIVIELSHDADAEHETLPHGPLFLAWFDAGRDSLSLGTDGQGWRWQR